MGEIKQINVYHRFRLIFEAKNNGRFFVVWNKAVNGYPIVFKVKLNEIDLFLDSIRNENIRIQYNK